MKKSLLIKRISVLFFALITFWQIGAGQVLLVENFDYTSGALLTANGWIAHSGAGSESITVNSSGLTFTGYPSSGIGLAALLDNTGEDVNKTFTAITTGPVYVATLVNIATPAAGYFFHIGENPMTTTFRCRFFMDAGSGSNFNFGFSKGTGTAVYTTGTPYSVGTTYLVVIKYNIIAGTSNDEASVFIINGAIPSTEPITPTLVATDIATQTDINPGSVGLRQYSATQNVIVDGIRVASTWNDAISDLNPPSPLFNPANAAIGVATNTIPTITFDEALRKADGSVLSDADLSSLITFKKTDALGDNVAFTATIDATKKVITVTPVAALLNSQVYYLAVGPVEDASGNESTLKSATFTTIGALTPTITVTYPNGGEVMYAGDLKTITWTTTNFDVAENVKVEVWAIDGSTGNYFWLTLEASTPNDGAYDVIVGIDATYGTDYRIKLSGVTNGASDESNGPFTVISTATTLANLKSYALGSKIKYTGEAIITFTRTANRNQKYIQDATAGLLIDDASGVLVTTLATGDKITNLEGTLGSFTGMFQLVPTVSTVTVLSTGNTVPVPALTIPEYTANQALYESMLIKIPNLTFPAADGSATFAASTQYTVNDGTNDLAFFTFKAGEGISPIVGTIIPSGTYTITGLALKYNTTVEIASRCTNDFELLTGIEKTSASSPVIYPVPARDMLTVRNISNISHIEILDATGRVIRSTNISGDSEIHIPVGDLTKGLYFLRLTTPTGKVTSKFIK